MEWQPVQSCNTERVRNSFSWIRENSCWSKVREAFANSPWSSLWLFALQCRKAVLIALEMEAGGTLAKQAQLWTSQGDGSSLLEQLLAQETLAPSASKQKLPLKWCYRQRYNLFSCISEQIRLSYYCWSSFFSMYVSEDKSFPINIVHRQY